jgi:AcrR family transcriptional regulator
MHSMPTSATQTPRREAQKRATERRIHRCALELTDERGLDSWTMEDLAEAADVSRRTLFNYFPGKVDAVLGGAPELPAEALATFHAGGPSGRLVDDLAALAAAVLAEHDFDPDLVALGRRALHQTPRLLVTAHERFELVMQELVDHILRREGHGFGEARARLLVRLLVAVFDDALHHLLHAPAGRTVAELFDRNVRQARDLFA